MKRETLTAARNWLVGSVLSAGFVYSLFALTLTPKPVYASSCNCVEEHAEADDYCANHGGLKSFNCPVGGPPQGPIWVAYCIDSHFTYEQCSGT